MTRRLLAAVLVLTLAACSSAAGTDGGGNPDSGQPLDAGDAGDSGTVADAGDGGLPDDGGLPGDGGDAGTADTGQATVSRSLALSADGTTLWVTNAESDSISQIDVATRVLRKEILLGAHAPAVDPVTQRYDPAVRPRAIALVDALGKAYVAGQSANRVFVVDLGTASVSTSIPVGAEPTAVVAAPDGSAVYVVSHQSATVTKIDTHSDAAVTVVPIGEHPWGASVRADGSLLYVSHLLLSPGVTAIDTATMTVAGFTALPDQPVDSAHNKLLPSGQVRVAYTVVPRPNTGELWIPHLLLATGTAQPSLDFESTAFPTISWLSPGAGSFDHRLLFRPSSLLTAPGSFTDSVSGPHDIAFTPDGQFALVAMAQSEDVMVFDANTGFEVALVRPTPSALLEGILVDAQGAHAYLHGRVSHNVTVLDVSESNGSAQVSVDGDPIECLAQDPMPSNLRHGFRLFYSSNSADFPITQNFWLACASCHPEGQSDAVTWKFAQGPRDTPSNAGGPINTGFLFRQATRNTVLDYDLTIRTEQGGSYDRTNVSQQSDLQALADFTNYAIPFPQNPNVLPDGGLTDSQARGQVQFAAKCANCHTGAFYTDSAAGNPTLDLDAGPIVLHDIGTCVLDGGYNDQPSEDVLGDARDACQFDTPSLRGIFASAPYFHDGSARTLDDVVARIPSAADLTDSERADLVAYLNTL
jgi:YVTN family beta-propeller protein